MAGLGVDMRRVDFILLEGTGDSDLEVLVGVPSDLKQWSEQHLTQQMQGKLRVWGEALVGKEGGDHGGQMRVLLYVNQQGAGS